MTPQEIAGLVSGFAAELVKRLAAYGPFPMDPNPLTAGVKTKKGTITLLATRGP